MLRFVPVSLLVSLVDNLSSKSLLGNESLNVWGFVVSLVSSFDFSSDNILSNIILTLSEGESLNNVGNSLWSESSWSLRIGEASDVLLSLNENFEGDDSKIWATDATSN